MIDAFSVDPSNSNADRELMKELFEECERLRPNLFKVIFFSVTADMMASCVVYCAMAFGMIVPLSETDCQEPNQCITKGLINVISKQAFISTGFYFILYLSRFIHSFTFLSFPLVSWPVTRTTRTSPSPTF